MHKVGFFAKTGRTCKFEDCTTRMSFGLPGEKATRCNTHAAEGMENVVSKTCGIDGCTTQMAFGLPGEKATRCKTHAAEGMIDVKNKICGIDGCTTQMSFGPPGEKATRCKTHAAEGMIDVKNKTCGVDGCTTRMVFGLPGENAARCKTHAAEGMIDVVSKTCGIDGCTTRMVFGLPGEKATRCKTHAAEGMIDVKHKTCGVDGCTTLMVFGPPGEKATRCKTHAAEGMIDVKNKRCGSSHCSSLASANRRYRGYCRYCFMHTYPGEPISRNFKTKERAVVEYVQETFPELSWQLDKRVADGCSKRRPDMLCDFGTHVVVVEVDENKHEGYNCESKRDMELWQDVGERSLVFIRFNPDAYGNVTSCWGTNKQGLCGLKKKKMQEWQDRLTQLGRRLQHWIQRIPLKMIERDELFY